MPEARVPPPPPPPPPRQRPQAAPNVDVRTVNYFYFISFYFFVLLYYLLLGMRLSPGGAVGDHCSAVYYGVPEADRKTEEVHNTS